MSVLARTGQPLKLADGRLVYPNGDIVDPEEEALRDKLISIPTNREAQQLVTAARRKLADLPDVPKTMNTVSVILSYSLFGLSDTEIALATGFTEDQIGTIKMNDAYEQMHRMVVENIIEADTDNIRELISRQSKTAVQQLVTTLTTSPSEDNRIAVAKDLLDRAGHRPADVVEHRHKMDGGLTIEIIHKDKTNVMPVIDLEVETVQ